MKIQKDFSFVGSSLYDVVGDSGLLFGTLQLKGEPLTDFQSREGREYEYILNGEKLATIKGEWLTYNKDLVIDVIERALLERLENKGA